MHEVDEFYNLAGSYGKSRDFVVLLLLPQDTQASMATEHTSLNGRRKMGRESGRKKRGAGEKIQLFNRKRIRSDSKVCFIFYEGLFTVKLSGTAKHVHTCTCTWRTCTCRTAR